MTVDIGLIFGALGVAKSVAEFAGILDSVESKIDRLVQSELSAGLRALEQAGHANSEEVSLLREARGCFNKAVGLETGYRRVVALLGLSLCHHWLGEMPNSKKSLEELLEINPVTTLKLAIAAGRSEFREYSPLTMLNQMKQRVRAGNESSREFADFWRKHPLVKYGALVFSARARKEYHRLLVLDAVDSSEEATAIRRIQESVSGHIGMPVPWLKALE